MPKVMLVEDDNNLREIYEARLAAEGYEIVSAHDGEEALALAVKERPDLIISDVMMPKISGFDMLDILRSTPETKNTRVIMMTALSQAEDRDRADKLGADRYLVKSQVTLEDVIKVAHEILNDSPATAPGAAPTATTAAPAAIPVTAAAAPVEAPTVVPAPAASSSTAPATPPPAADKADTVLVEPPASFTNPVPPADPAVAAVPTTTVTDVSDEPKEEPQAVEAPLETPVPSAPAITEPAEEPKQSAPVPASVEPAKEEPQAGVPAVKPIDKDLTQTKTEETDVVEKQIQDFVASNPSLSTSAESTDSKPAEKPAAKSIPVIEIPTAEEKPVEKPKDDTPTIKPAASGNVPTPQNEDDTPPKPAEEKDPNGTHKKLVITPTENALAPAVDLNALLAKEAENEAAETPQANAVIAPSTTTSTETGTTSSADPSDPNQIAL